MTNEIELKPCPFCGGKADFNNDGGRWQQVICGSCGCRGCEYPINKSRAAEFWNRRPNQEAGLLDRIGERSSQADWKLVPVKLTEEMANAMECQFSTESQWEAALNAAPSNSPFPSTTFRR